MSENSDQKTTNDVDDQKEINSDQNEASLPVKGENYEELYNNSLEKIKFLESELQKSRAQHMKEREEVVALQAKADDTLTKAKSMLFEKTKVIKNQELQIEALNQQIDSLKDVVSITKDLLEIRNLEVKQLESKMQCMEDKIGAEKERHDLMHKKLEHMIRYNGDLKREYETQLCLFSALRERYSERELAKGVLDDEATSSGTSTQVNGTAEEGPSDGAAEKKE